MDKKITDLTLQYEDRTYTDKNGQERNYRVFYVVINGLDIEVRPVDNTGRQILDQVFKD